MSYIFKHLEKGSTQGSGNYVFRKYSEPAPVPQEEYFLKFSSEESFTISTYNNLKNWDGTVEISTDKTNWSTWDGTSTLNSASDGTNHNIYIRGTSNTYIVGNNGNARWILTPSSSRKISCTGNIENLLDYATVALGSHPPMADYCFYRLFYNNRYILTPPTLPATTLSNYCYREMFNGVYRLNKLPKLPALNLTSNCYRKMFYQCIDIAGISETQTDEYINEYRVPFSGNGTTGSNSLTDMFTNLTPQINTTYYVKVDVV